jgi:hypothetical protein
MSVPSPRPVKDEAIGCNTTSIGATPVAACTIAPKSGYVQRVMAAAAGTTTGTIAVAVSINNGADITGGALTIAAGSNSRAGSVQEFPGVGTTSGIPIIEGDSVVFTPSGGGGASIPGSFGLVIR